MGNAARAFVLREHDDQSRVLVIAVPLDQVKRLARWLLARRTRSALRFDLRRLRARVIHQRGRKRVPPHRRLHFGCGARWIPGWLNVDVVGSEYDIDLAAPLPWSDAVFDTIVSQQVLEHLEIEDEVAPLLDELARVSQPQAEFWASCPDLEKVCRSYFENGGRGLLEDRRKRVPVSWPDGRPHSQMINVLFHQNGEHKNLYDFPLLKWLLETHGFRSVERVNEAALRARFPEFPARGDDYHALYVRAVRSA